MIAASAGNHALALAYHGHSLKIPVTVVMPIIAPMMKVNLCRHYGADVIVMGEDINVVSKGDLKCLSGVKCSVVIQRSSFCRLELRLGQI